MESSNGLVEEGANRREVYIRAILVSRLRVEGTLSPSIPFSLKANKGEGEERTRGEGMDSGSGPELRGVKGKPALGRLG